MKQEYRPLIPVNPRGLDEIAYALLQGTELPENDKGKENPDPTRAVASPASYIILDGKTQGTYSYPDLVVSMHRLAYSPEVEKAVKWMRTQGDDWKNLTLSNSAKEADGTDYVGNINWRTALTLNQKLCNVTLNLRQFIDFKELLEAGIDGKRKVYNGLGKQIDRPVITSIYKEMFEVRDPWRSEWLDGAFSDQNGDLYLTQDHVLKGNSLQGRTEKLEDHVSEDGWIDVTSFNRQGLPTKKSRAQKLYYWSPVAGRVARFVAYSGWADLDCYGDPSDSSSNLGVRAARKKT